MWCLINNDKRQQRDEIFHQVSSEVQRRKDFRRQPTRLITKAKRLDLICQSEDWVRTFRRKDKRSIKYATYIDVQSLPPGHTFLMNENGKGAKIVT